MTVREGAPGAARAALAREAEGAEASQGRIAKALDQSARLLHAVSPGGAGAHAAAIGCRPRARLTECGCARGGVRGGNQH